MTLPAGKGSDILSISAKTNRVHGRVKTLPYSKNEVRLEICKHQFIPLFFYSSRRDSFTVNCPLSTVNLLSKALLLLPKADTHIKDYPPRQLLQGV